MRQSLAAPLFALVLGLGAAPASAELRRFEFSGTMVVTTPLARAGDEVRGTFAYDSDAQPSFCMSTSDCSYHFDGPGITMTVGSHTLTTTGFAARVQNDMGYEGLQDMVELWGLQPAVLDGKAYPFGFVKFLFAASKKQVLAGVDLPRSFEVHRYDTSRNAAFTTGETVTIDSTWIDIKLDSIRQVRGQD